MPTTTMHLFAANYTDECTRTFASLSLGGAAAGHLSKQQLKERRRFQKRPIDRENPGVIFLGFCNLDAF
jgi:hypothetical protein